HQQQDHLLDDEPAAVALLRLEQELHRRPANALEAHAVDQVDQDRRADERPAGRHVPGMSEEFHEALPIGAMSWVRGGQAPNSYRSYKSYTTYTNWGARGADCVSCGRGRRWRERPCGDAGT